MKKTFFNFQDPINSYPLNERQMGILKPGRYKGYTKLSKESTGVYKITHEPVIRLVGSLNTEEYDPLTEFSLTRGGNTDGKVTSDKSLLLNYGVCIMPTGIVIHDNDEIRVNITQNNLLGPRYDLLVVNHEYLNIAGGQAPTYEVISATVMGQLPTLPSQDKKIALGVFEVPAGDLSTVTVKYKPLVSPQLGDMGLQELANIILGKFEIADATTDNKGIVKLTTIDEAKNEGNSSLALTPEGFYNNKATTNKYGITLLSSAADLTSTPTQATSNKSVTVGNMISELPKMNNNVTRLSNATYTLKPEDNGKIFYGASNANTTIIVTVPAGLPSSYHVGFLYGTSNIQVNAQSTTIIKKVNSSTKMVEVGSAMLLNSTGLQNEYILTGDLHDPRYD